MTDGTTTQSVGDVQEEAAGNGNNSERSDAELLRLFVGPNADKFLRIYNAQLKEKDAFSFNWVVLIATLPWLFYRKLYVVGIGLILLPVILVLIFPDLARVGTMSFAGVMAVTANSIYVHIALRRIKKLKALNLPPAERDERIRNAGGTSPAGAVFGTLIVASMIALAFLDQTSAKLPGCDDPQVQGLARNVLTDALSHNSVDSEALKLSDFRTVDSAEDGSQNLCSFSAELEADSSTMYLSVTWRNRKAREFEISVGSTRDAVSQ